MEALLTVQQVVSSSTGLNHQRSGTVDAGGFTARASLPATVQAGGDPVSLSREGREQNSLLDSSRSTTESDSAKSAGKVQLDRQEIEQLQELKRRDKEVRSHEQAHLSAAGQYARGGMSFTFQKGPDGVAYAVGGEVGIDLGEETTPEATLLKMQIIKRAALAPAIPSGADRQIAARAVAEEAEARQEMLRETQEEVLKAVSHPLKSDDPAALEPTPADSEVARPSSSYVSLKSAIAAYKRTAES